MSKQSRQRVLFVSHGHPSLLVGGAEVHAYNLFRAFRNHDGFEPFFLARTIASGHRSARNTPFRAIDGAADEILWSPGDFDDLMMTLVDRRDYVDSFDRLLRRLRPDVVHFQHTSGLGFPMVRQVRRSLPEAAILYTLHEFQPICHSDGLMVRTSGELCDEASPVRCHDCFPEIAPEVFFLRERLIRSHLRFVDLFLAPSRYLLGQYYRWGIEPERIRFEDYGRKPTESPGATRPSVERFAFLGQVAPHKGVLVLLEAMRLLEREGGCAAHLHLHGGNLGYQTSDFQRQFADLASGCANVTVTGRYGPEDAPSLVRSAAWIVVPSIWWENSPLVIQEAFMHGRPVICSDIGGMAEKVRDGVDGLHFKTSSPLSLAAAIRRAASSPELWDRLTSQILPVYRMDDTVEVHASLFRDLIARRRSKAAS